MSCKDFMVSEQMEFENQKFYRRNERRLKIKQRSLSKKEKGSHNKLKQKHRLARQYENTTNQRKGFQRNLVHLLTQKFDGFCFEDLNIEGMKLFNSGVSKTVTSDFSWNEFITYFEWKCKDKGKHFTKISRWFPSSKMCSECGTIKDELKLSDRTFKCDCGFVIDRDINATRNIFKAGIEQFKENGVVITTPLGVNLSNPTAEYAESHACGVMSVGYKLSPGTISLLVVKG
jgi:putative transposase